MRFVKNEMYLISTCRCDGCAPLCIVTGVTDVMVFSSCNRESVYLWDIANHLNYSYIIN